MSAHNVLVDGTFLMQMAVIQPTEPTLAIVETPASGPIVVHRTRVEPIA